MLYSIRTWLLPLLAVVVLFPGLALAHGDLQETRAERRRRATEAAEKRTRERDREDSARRLAGWLNSISPEARAREEARENYYLVLRLDSFLKDVIQFEAHVFSLSVLSFAPLDEIWAIQDVRRRARDLEEKTERLLDFIDSGSDAPKLVVGTLPEESLDRRLGRIDRLSRRLIPRIITLTTGDLLDLTLQREVRRDLFLMLALSHDIGG